jgi:hypothetical protein
MAVDNQVESPGIILAVVSLQPALATPAETDLDQLTAGSTLIFVRDYTGQLRTR